MTLVLLLYRGGGGTVITVPGPSALFGAAIVAASTLATPMVERHTELGIGIEAAGNLTAAVVRHKSILQGPGIERDTELTRPTIEETGG